jgi:two-component system OmpR family sensor kinase
MRFRSLRTRLVAITVALAAVGLVVAGIATYAALRSFLVDRVDRTLEASTPGVERALTRGGPGGIGGLGQAGQLTPGLYVEVRDPNGRELLGQALTPPGEVAKAPKLPSSIDASAGPVRMTVGAKGGGSGFRVRAETMPFGIGTLILAAPLAETNATLDRLAMIELLVAAGVLLSIAVVGVILVRRGLRPLERIEADAAAIGAGDLSRRVEADDLDSEVGRLGHALNAMLGQIEGAFAERAASEERLRRFVSDASHELRTPVAAVRAYAELFDRGARDRPDDLERAMGGIQREAVRIGVLVEDLLLLARLDQGRPLVREPVDLGEIARDAVDAARVMDPDRALDLHVAGPVPVIGDAQALRQVVDNLLANVRAHTPPGTPARVGAHALDGQAVLAVEDDGPGLDAEAAARVFERFYRVDSSRARTAGGAGLGLAIVQAIVEAHGGRVAVTGEPGAGATFTVTLAAAPLGVGEGVVEQPLEAPDQRLRLGHQPAVRDDA